jgi:hypothetical protein
MHVNGRLTAPPDLQAELATNSVRRNLLQGSDSRPEARGNPLENLSQGTSGQRTTRSRERHACSGNSGPVSAAQFLFGNKEGAAAS